MVLSLLLRDECVDKVEKSKVPDKHFGSVAKKAQASGPSEGGAELLGPVFVRRMRSGTQGPLSKRDGLTGAA